MALLFSGIQEPLQKTIIAKTNSLLLTYHHFRSILLAIKANSYRFLGHTIMQKEKS